MSKNKTKTKDIFHDSAHVIYGRSGFDSDVLQLIDEAESVKLISPKASIMLCKSALEVFLKKHVDIKDEKMNLSDVTLHGWRQGKITTNTKNLCDFIRVTGNRVAHHNVVGCGNEDSPDAVASLILISMYRLGYENFRLKIHKEFCDNCISMLPPDVRESIERRDGKTK